MKLCCPLWTKTVCYLVYFGIFKNKNSKCRYFFSHWSVFCKTTQCTLYGGFQQRTLTYNERRSAVARCSGFGVWREHNIYYPETRGVMKPQQKNDQQHRAEVSRGPHVSSRSVWCRTVRCVGVCAAGGAGRERERGRRAGHRPWGQTSGDMTVLPDLLLKTSLTADTVAGAGAERVRPVLMSDTPTYSHQ